jgi:hypothetical protein
VPTVAIPYRDGCPHRKQALATVLARFGGLGWTVKIGTLEHGPWVKALAVMPVVAECPPGPVVISDADVWCDGTPQAVSAVEGGERWAIPHLLVHRLGVDGEPCERPYPGVQGGGIIVADRDTLMAVPMDPRFVGWGQEDLAHAVALRCLEGPAWRGEADLTHMWHPPQPRLSRKWGSLEGRRLFRRYQQFRRDPDGMRQLIGEARAHLDTHQPDLHDRQTV